MHHMYAVLERSEVGNRYFRTEVTGGCVLGIDIRALCKGQQLNKHFS